MSEDRRKAGTKHVGNDASFRAYSRHGKEETRTSNRLFPRMCKF